MNFIAEVHCHRKSASLRRARPSRGTTLGLFSSLSRNALATTNVSPNLASNKRVASLNES